MANKKYVKPIVSDEISEGVQYLRDELPFLEIVDQNTISTSAGGLVQVIQFSGLDFKSFTESKRKNLFLIRKRFFSSLSDMGVTASFFFNRKEIKVENISEENFPTIREAITKYWDQKFDNSFITEIFLVLRYQVPIENKLFDFLDNNEKSREKLKLSAIKLKNESELVISTMQDFNPVLLNVETGLLDFYQYLINNNCAINPIIRSQDVKLNDLISLTDIEFDMSENIISFFNNDKKRYCGIIYPKTYPLDSSSELIFDSLLACDCEFNLINHILPEAIEDSKNFSNKIIKKLKSVASSEWFSSRYDDILEVKERLDMQEISILKYLFVIQVFADSKEELKERVKNIQTILSRSSIPSISSPIGLINGYFNAFPDYQSMIKSRHIKYTNENLADLITIKSDSQGFRKSDFGDEEIVKFKTTSNSNYFFNLHSSSSKNAESHTLIIGSTNSGKSTLSSFILANALKFDKMKILCFDSMQGLYIPINSFDGKYTDFEKDKIELNPFLLEDNFNNKVFLRDFIKNLAGGVKNKKEEDDISSFVRNNFKINKDSRNLSLINQISSSKEEDSLSHRLEKYFPNKDFGKYFNSKKNILSFEDSFLGFNMTTLLNPRYHEVLIPIFRYITYSFEEYIRKNPSPHIVFVDEVGTYIKSNYFADFIEKAAQEWRKSKGTIMLACQNPAQILDHENGQKIITNISNYIIFPDPNADAKYYMGDLNLNEEEFAWVKNSNIYERNILFKRKNGNSQILNVNLSFLGNYLNLFSSSNDYVLEFQNIEKEHRDKNKVIEEFIKIFPNND